MSCVAANYLIFLCRHFFFDLADEVGSDDAPHDVVVLMDSSSSISDEEFKLFMTALADQIQVSYNGRSDDNLNKFGNT